MNEKEKRRDLARQYKERAVTGGVWAVVNRETGRILLGSDMDPAGSRNRFAFAQKTGSCVLLKLNGDWQKYGPDAFEFSVLEEIEMQPDQTLRQFREDLSALEEIWREKLTGKLFY